MARQVCVIFLVFFLTILFVLPPDVARAVSGEADGDHKPIALYVSLAEVESEADSMEAGNHLWAGAESCNALGELAQSGDSRLQIPAEIVGLVEAAIEKAMASFPQASDTTTCDELASWLYLTNPENVSTALRGSLSELRSRHSELKQALGRLPHSTELRPGSDPEVLATWARERLAKYDPESPFLATGAQIQEVADYLGEIGVEVDREDIITYSRFWYEGQSLEERAREPITLTTIAVAASIGALVSLGQYALEHWLNGEEFECLGMVKAIYTGAVMGILGEALHLATGVAKIVFSVPDLNAYCATMADVIASQFDLQPALVQTGMCGYGSIALEWINNLLIEAIWAPSPIRLAAVAGCSAWDSKELRRGGFSGVKAWVEYDLVPAIITEYGLQFITIQNTLDIYLAGSGDSPEDIPNITGNLWLEDQTNSRDVTLLLTNDTVDYTFSVQSNQPGNYAVRVKVFRGGVDRGAVITRTYTTTISYDEQTFSGSLNVGQMFSLAGNVEGDHELRIEVQNTTEGWTEWVTEDGVTSAWGVEIRNNRRPAVSLDCATLLGLTKCEVFVRDPDGNRPQSLYLSVNGADENLTSELPALGVDWDEGYTVVRNYYWPQGIYTLRARVSDGQFTMYSGDIRDLRVATLPYPVFPAVTLTNVGETHTYSVRWEDSIGGIPGQKIYVSTSNRGNITNLSGELIQSVVTGSNGWAYFDYTPMETGRHSLTVAVDHYELSQTSNYVAPGCEPPSRPYLDAPYNGEDEVPTTVDLVWDTDNDASTYDVYFGDSYPPPMIDNVPYQEDDIHYQVSNLAAGDEFFWKIVAHGECDPTQTTDSWSSHFFTLGAPEPATLLKPTNGATDQPIGLVVDWANVSTPGTFLYELYLDDTNPPALNEAMGTRTEKLFDGSSPSNTLDPTTTYYWNVIARSAEDPNLFSQSATWTFTTGEGITETVVIQAYKDAGLRGGAYGNHNYGGDFNGEAEQKYYGAGNGDDFFLDMGDEPLRGAVQFDLSSFTPGTNIINATLTLDPVQGSNLPGTTSDIYFDPFQTSWSEMSITWNNRPSINLSYRVTGVFPPSGWNPLDNDVSSLVQAWVDGNISNYGLLFSIPSWESVADRYIMFNQRESRLDQSRAATLTITYGVPCDPTDPPALQLPSNGATDVAEAVTLEWADVAGASNYNLYFGTSPSPPKIALVTGSSYSVSGLSAATTYYWMVEALADCDATVTSPSAVWSFTTSSCITPPAPTIIAPADGATGIGHLVTLSWNASAGASSYKVYAGTNNPPTTLVANVETTSAPMYVLAERTYYWFVHATAACDGSLTVDSPVAAFVTAAGPIADAGSDRVAGIRQPTALGGLPSGSSGTPPYMYSWSVTPGAGWTMDSNTVANPVFTGTTYGEFWCGLTVTDSLGFESATSLVKVSVQNELVFSDGFESGDTSKWSSSIP